MSATSTLAASAAQEGLEQARQNIREQVRQDVEKALSEVRAARTEAQAQAAIEGAIEGAVERGMAVPAPPPPPGRRIVVGPPGRQTEVFVGTGQPPMPFDDIPPRVQEVAFGFFLTVAVIFIGTPLARAFGRRLDRKAVAPAAGGPDVLGRLDRIEQAVEAVAIEVERISEGQRYVTKVMTESRALPSPNEAAANEIRMAERGAAERAAGERVR